MGEEVNKPTLIKWAGDYHLFEAQNVFPASYSLGMKLLGMAYQFYVFDENVKGIEECLAVYEYERSMQNKNVRVAFPPREVSDYVENFLDVLVIEYFDALVAGDSDFAIRRCFRRLNHNMPRVW